MELREKKHIIYLRQTLSLAGSRLTICNKSLGSRNGIGAFLF